MKTFKSVISLIITLAMLPGHIFAAGNGQTFGIDRKAVVERNNPHVTAIDKLASLSVGNGGFAVTVDATGLQSFTETN